ncbi:MAG: hypothetical protein AAFU71_15670 [Cyanobacteria bacterium J06632_22]
MSADLRTLAPFTALLSREQYVTCRIVLPDEPKPLPAIRLGERYYSFFRTVSQAEQALALVTKLCYRDNCVVIVKIAKGYSLWVEEPDAFPHSFSKLMDYQPEPTFSRILVADEQFQMRSLSVPDLDKSIPGIEFQQRYYSIFRKEPSAAAVIQIVAQLAERNDESVLLSAQQYWTICIAEPEAISALMAV